MKTKHREPAAGAEPAQRQSIAPPALDGADAYSAEQFEQVGANGTAAVPVAGNLQPRPALKDLAAASSTADRDGSARPLVMMLGLRGVPDVQGGIERHVEMLCQELARDGWSVEVLGRRPYLKETKPFTWKGMKVTPLRAPRSMMLEAFVHTFSGILYAALKRPHILHIHAIGPGLLVPLARLFGLRVVTTHHGYDYDREKWGAKAKKILRLGERLAVKTSHATIAVSRDVTETMQERYDRRLSHVPNGVLVRPAVIQSKILERFGLTRRRYVVMVARIVPEKRQTDLIKAFAQLRSTDWKLAIVGGADHKSRYHEEVEALARDVPGVVMTGFQSGDDLAGLFSQAGLFVLPSLHEGMPISLLEAMSYGLPVLASDIPANHEVELPDQDYFPPGDVDALAAALRRKLAEPFDEHDALARIRHTEKNYTWSSIAGATTAVYQSILAGGKIGKRS